MQKKIDFQFVPQEHKDIDDRLRNWGRWNNSGSGAGQAPMWRWTQPTARAKEDAYTSTPVDVLDAQKIQNAYKQMTSKQRAVLCWCYVKNSRPGILCKTLDISLETLMQLLHTARDEMQIKAGEGMDFKVRAYLQHAEDVYRQCA